MCYSSRREGKEGNNAHNSGGGIISSKRVQNQKGNQKGGHAIKQAPERLIVPESIST
jgi:hypothetical protein